MGQIEKALAAARAVLADARTNGRAVAGRHAGVPVRFVVEASSWCVYADLGPLFTVGTIRPRVRFLFRHGHVFDRSFSVADAIAPLLDAPLRARLLALAPHIVRMTTRGVEIEKRYSYYYAEDDDIALAIRVAAELAARARDAAVDEEDAIRARLPHDGPFRRAADPHAAERAIEARLVALRRIEPRPERSHHWTAWVALALLTTSVYALLH